MLASLHHPATYTNTMTESLPISC
uniref:Uncharacterized protein n=1 Tax=Arundo donax TaxID=35708 RepID=A0A0A9HC99_ARUDO